MTTGSARRVAHGVFLLLVTAGTAFAQRDFEILLSPERPDFDVIADTSATWYPDEKVERRADRLGLTTYKASIRAMIKKGTDSDSYIGFDAALTDVRGNVRIPASVDRVPQSLYDTALVYGYRKQLDAEHLAGGMAAVRSASDAPFSSTDVMSMRATVFYNLARGEYRSWFFFLDGDTNRDWPIVPGIAYQYYFLIAGVPICAIVLPLDQLNLNAMYLMPDEFSARLDYFPIEKLGLFMTLAITGDAYQRKGKRDDDDKLVFRESRVSAGASWAFNEKTMLELSAGYTFDRSLSEGGDRDEREDRELDWEDTWFAKLSLNLKF
jgi:hypothetical protein